MNLQNFIYIYFYLLYFHYDFKMVYHSYIPRLNSQCSLLCKIYTHLCNLGYMVSLEGLLLMLRGNKLIKSELQ